MSDCDYHPHAMNHPGKPLGHWPGGPPHPHTPGLPVRHGHRILGRITRHSLGRRDILKRAGLPVQGCPKIPVGHAALLPLLPDGRTFTALKAIPTVSHLAAVLGGSGVLGGFGTTPNGGASPFLPDGPHFCIGIACGHGIVLAEPISFGLLAAAVTILFLQRTIMFLFEKKNQEIFANDVVVVYDTDTDVCPSTQPSQV